MQLAEIYLVEVTNYIVFEIWLKLRSIMSFLFKLTYLNIFVIALFLMMDMQFCSFNIYLKFKI